MQDIWWCKVTWRRASELRVHRNPRKWVTERRASKMKVN